MTVGTPKAQAANGQALDDRILEFLGAQGFAEGERLPTERELSARFDVSRATLRVSLARLERDGVLWRHIGKGTFFGARPSEDGKSLISLISGVMSPHNLIEFQLVVEPACSALAAMRANGRDIERLGDVLNRMRNATSGDDFSLWDNRFHLHIVEFSKNNLISSIFDALSAEKSFRVFGALREHMTTSASRAAYLAEHDAVYTALCRRDSTAAEARMREHLTHVARDLLQLDPYFGLPSTHSMESDDR